MDLSIIRSFEERLEKFLIFIDVFFKSFFIWVVKKNGRFVINV